MTAGLTCICSLLELIVGCPARETRPSRSDVGEYDREAGNLFPSWQESVPNGPIQWHSGVKDSTVWRNNCALDCRTIWSCFGRASRDDDGVDFLPICEKAHTPRLVRALLYTAGGWICIRARVASKTQTLGSETRRRKMGVLKEIARAVHCVCKSKEVLPIQGTMFVEQGPKRYRPVISNANGVVLGRSLGDQLAGYGSLARRIGLAAQVIFAIFPVVQVWRR